MNRRNRRRKPARAALVPAPLVGGMVLCATLAMLYLWMDHTCSALGQQIRDLETTQTRLRNEWVRERNKWSSMRTPANLERALLRHGLVMGMARPEQVVHVQGERRTQPYVEHAQWARLEAELAR